MHSVCLYMARFYAILRISIVICERFHTAWREEILKISPQARCFTSVDMSVITCQLNFRCVIYQPLIKSDNSICTIKV